MTIQVPGLPLPLRIRPAVNADAESVRELVFAVLSEYGLRGDPEGYDSDLKDIEASYLQPGGWFEVVETEDGKLVGTIGLFPRAGGVCELRKMYLAPAVRGHGLGRALLERALRQARRLGFSRVELETSSRLREAVRLYTRYGFQPIAHDHAVERCDAAYALDLTDRGGREDESAGALI